MHWNAASYREDTEFFQGDGENDARSNSLRLLPFLGVYCPLASTEVTNQAYWVFWFSFSLPNQSTWCGKKASTPALGFISFSAHF